jgi:quercetin dioxygenase-like cupin family protein
MKRIDHWGVAEIARAATVLAVVFTGTFLARGRAQTATPSAPAPGGVQRILLTKADVSVPGREADAMRAEIAPGASTGRHTHPGDEIDYVIQGQIEITFDGQGPHVLESGDALVIPMGTVHNAVNVGSIPAIISAVFVVEKGKPLVAPAP